MGPHRRPNPARVIRVTPGGIRVGGAEMGVLGPTFGVTIIPMFEDKNWVEVELRKAWYVVGPGGQSRTVAKTAFNRQGMGEAEVLEAALLELLRTLADRMA